MVLESKRILIVEDEDDIRDLVKIQFESQGCQTIATHDGNHAIDLLQSESFDLFVLDRMLPGTNGLEICKFIRNYKPTKNYPILFLTALTEPDQIVEGLEAGADDYITKPFDMNVLIARARSLMRRYQLLRDGGSQKIECEIFLGKIRINTDQCQVWINEEKISLTLSEYRILYYLALNTGKVLSRKELVRCIQGEDVHVTERTIDTHIYGLRKKLKEETARIETIRGIGYRVVQDEK